MWRGLVRGKYEVVQYNEVKFYKITVESIRCGVRWNRGPCFIIYFALFRGKSFAIFSSWNYTKMKQGSTQVKICGKIWKHKFMYFLKHISKSYLPHLLPEIIRRIFPAAIWLTLSIYCRPLLAHHYYNWYLIHFNIPLPRLTDLCPNQHMLTFITPPSTSNPICYQAD